MKLSGHVQQPANLGLPSTSSTNSNGYLWQTLRDMILWQNPTLSSITFLFGLVVIGAVDFLLTGDHHVNILSGGFTHQLCHCARAGRLRTCHAVGTYKHLVWQGSLFAVQLCWILSLLQSHTVRYYAGAAYLILVDLAFNRAHTLRLGPPEWHRTYPSGWDAPMSQTSID